MPPKPPKREPRYPPTAHLWAAAYQSAIAHLIQHGFSEAGVTEKRTVSVQDKEVELGGRKRYVLHGTPYRVTVGPQTLCIYEVIQGEVAFLGTYNTLDEITKFQKHIDRIAG